MSAHIFYLAAASSKEELRDMEEKFDAINKYEDPEDDYSMEDEDEEASCK